MRYAFVIETGRPGSEDPRVKRQVEVGRALLDGIIDRTLNGHGLVRATEKDQSLILDPPLRPNLDEIVDATGELTLVGLDIGSGHGMGCFEDTATARRIGQDVANRWQLALLDEPGQLTTLSVLDTVHALPESSIRPL